MVAYRGECFCGAVQISLGEVRRNGVKIEINQSHPLKDAALAHRDLESRKTVGSTVLTV
jgi:NADPH:quinone reductase-like Zn-dependent oxidoreductase